MKRMLSILMALLLVMSTGALVVFAESGQPVISFSRSSQTIYGGQDYTVTVESEGAVSTDTTVSLSGNGKVFSAMIKAGESSASVSFSSEAVTETAEFVFSIEEGSGYSLGAGSSHTVEVCPRPVFDIYPEMICHNAGGDGYVLVECKTPSLLVAPYPLSVRCDDGSVLVNYEFPTDKKSRYIYFTAPTEYNPEGKLHLYDDVTGEKLDSVNLALVVSGCKMIRTVESSDKVAISFDCAYGSYNVDFVLDTLDKYDAKATFFMTGFFVREHPDAVRKIAERGHEIGNHSNNHPHLNKKGAEDVYKEIMICNREIVEATGGVQPTLFRPPYGEINNTAYAVVRSCGLDVIRWSADAFDYDFEYPIEKSIRCATENVGAGDIVIFHTSATHIKKTLDACLQNYVDKGLKIVNISDLLIDGPSIITPEGRQIADPSSTAVTAAELLSGYTFELPAAGTETTVALEPSFSEEEIYRTADDIEALKADPSLFQCAYDAESVDPSLAPGEKACSAVLSYNGEDWFTVELFAAQPEAEEIAPESQPAEGTEPDSTSTDEDAEPGSSCAQLKSFGTMSILAHGLLILAVVVLAAIVIRKKATK